VGAKADPAQGCCVPHRFDPMDGVAVHDPDAAARD